MSKLPSEKTVTMLQANLYSLPIILLIIIIMSGSYIMLWSKEALLEGFRVFRSPLTFILLIIAFSLHEAIHFSGYHFLGKAAFKKIKIGFQTKSLTPYAYCSEPMNVNAYRWSAFLPGLILGILPGSYFLLQGNPYGFIFSIIMTVAAGGDLLLLWLLRKIPASAQVQDHPEKAGCIILEKD